MNRYALASITAMIMGLGLVAASTQSDHVATPVPYEPIVATVGFNVVHPIRLGTAEDMKHQMTERLQYVESMLRARDVGYLSEELRAERLRNLDRLRDYRIRGLYPANAAYPNQLRPCFIDGDGNICAVGYLVEQSAGRPLAEQINARFQYATVNEMKSKKLEEWIARSGFTHAEVETIQEPGFQKRPPLREHPVMVKSAPSAPQSQPANVAADTSRARAAAQPAIAQTAVSSRPSPKR